MDNEKIIYKVHTCEQMPKTGIRIDNYGEYSNDSDASYCLTIYREATQKDVEENCNFENVGEMVWLTVIDISHCPYCGVSLYDDDKKLSAQFETLRHFDYSGWSTKEC